MEIKIIVSVRNKSGAQAEQEVKVEFTHDTKAILAEKHILQYIAHQTISTAKELIDEIAAA